MLMHDEPWKVFEKDVGTWDAEVVVRPGPGAPEQRSSGLSVARMIGGRWLLIDFKNENGFEGHGVYGWDDARKAYVGQWVDGMRGFMVIMEGAWDAETRTMTFRAQAQLDGGRLLAWRESTEAVDDDTQVMRQFFAAPGEPGGELETLTATYRRRK
jgi:hypothetical protein